MPDIVTNADHIRNMTDEELANQFAGVTIFGENHRPKWRGPHAEECASRDVAFRLWVGWLKNRYEEAT